MKNEAEPPDALRPEPFVLPVAMWQAIVDHARAEAPRECCGVIGGSGGRPVAIFPLPNVAPGNRLYEIDSRALLDLEFSVLPERGLEIVAIYHSHPESTAVPSPTDLAQATWPNALYLICSLAVPGSPVIRGFWIEAGEAVEATVQKPTTTDSLVL